MKAAVWKESNLGNDNLDYKWSAPNQTLHAWALDGLNNC